MGEYIEQQADLWRKTVEGENRRTEFVTLNSCSTTFQPFYFKYFEILYLIQQINFGMHYHFCVHCF